MTNDWGWKLSNVLAGTLLPVGIMMADTIPGLRQVTDVGRKNASDMVTVWGPLLGIARGDLFDYVLLLSVFAVLMVTCWVPKFQLAAVILMIWLPAYFGVVGAYMAISQIPPGPAVFFVIVPLLVFNAIWRALHLHSMAGVGKKSDPQLVGLLIGWAISCFVIVFLGLSGIMYYRSPMLVASAELAKDQDLYFEQAENGSWPAGASTPDGFVAERALLDAAAEEQAGLILIPWWCAVGVMWAMFATIGSLALKSAKESAAKADTQADTQAVKLLA